MRPIESLVSSNEVHKKIEVVVEDRVPYYHGFDLPLGDITQAVWEVTRESDTKSKLSRDFYRHTITMGRAGYIPLAFEDDLHRRYGCIVVKSTGIPKHFGESNLPYYYDDTMSEWRGYARYDDLLLDSTNSIDIYEKGIRARLPIRTFKRVNTSKTTPGLYKTAFAMETPFRFEDIDRLNLDKPTVAPEVTAYTKAPGYKDLTKARVHLLPPQQLEELKLHLAVDLLNKAIPFAKLQPEYKSTKQLYTGTNQYYPLLKFMYMRTVELANAVKQANVTHLELSSHQISIHGEMCDNSSVTQKKSGQFEVKNILY